ncbi:MAG: ATP-binding protein [Clostridia bacterium]|nr:ATP-binding protein [Clostridia bacterium]
MLRSIQTKIVMIFMILGILIIASLGLFFIYNLNTINNSITTEIMSIEDVRALTLNQMNYTKNVIYGFMIAFMIAVFALGVFISKVIIKPISRLIKSAELITKGEQVDTKYMTKSKAKSHNEIDDLVDAFSLMHAELKENLNEVTRQKNQIETILLHMTDGVIAFNIDGKIIHINPAAKTFLNVDETMDFEEIFEKFNVDINMEKIIYLENWTSSEKKVNVDNRAINLFFAPFKNENDRPAGVIVVIQDITEHVKLDSMRKQFVADVSHELQTPITTIIGYSETLMDNHDIDKELQMNFLSRIFSEANRMSHLVKDLLTLSRYDTAKVKIEKKEFDLGELVKYTFEGLKLEMDKKNQTGECFVTADVPKVYADRSGLERVVINILTNAIKYTNEGGVIKVYVGFVYNDAYIKIIDNGIGITKEDLDKIFERFYRVDKARTREMGGTGLGLSIAKEILDKNDSRIDIKSEFGKGTEVVIRIPTKKVNIQEKERN